MVQFYFSIGNSYSPRIKFLVYGLLFEKNPIFGWDYFYQNDINKKSTVVCFIAELIVLSKKLLFGENNDIRLY